jgi:hypothetical protein
MPKHKFENLGSRSNYRGSLPYHKENVSSKIMIPFFTKKQNIVQATSHHMTLSNMKGVYLILQTSSKTPVELI